MMKTKKKRLKFYKQLLKVVCEDPDTCVGMCYYIGRIINVERYAGDELIKQFPELWKHKPKRMCYVAGYWFPLDDKGWQKRIDIIHNIIQEMENDGETTN